MENLKNITPEFIEQDDKVINENGNKKFNPKNYLNVTLDSERGETKKEIKIRILPIDSNDSNPFKRIYMHTIKVPREISKSGWKSYVCLEKTSDIDHDKLGHSCPFCELNRKAFAKYEESENEVLKSRYKQISLDNLPKEVCIVRCIERGAESDGPKFWKFNVRQDKKDPKHIIKNLYTTRKQEAIDEGEEPINILDIYNGKDLKITIGSVTDKDGKATKKTSIDIVDYGKIKPLSESEEEMYNWINDKKVWSDVFVAKPYEYLSLIIEGKKPFYDSKTGKWVENGKFDNNNEELPEL